MENKWKFKQLKNINTKSGILIGGLPGMGNVGKIALDFMIETLKANKVYEINSYNLPHCVFINENNILELPKIMLYHKKIKEKDFFFLSGDVQPLTEVDCYEFCDNLLKHLSKYNIKEIITLGGIGLLDIPEKQKLYYALSEEKLKKKFKSIKRAHTIVGPIVGISGILIGMGKERKIPGAILLAETFSHPGYLGIRGAREILSFLNKNYDFGLKISTLDKEIKEIESEIKDRMDQIVAVQEDTGKKETINYIG